MRIVLEINTLDIPDNVKLEIKARQVCGPETGGEVGSSTSDRSPVLVNTPAVGETSESTVARPLVPVNTPAVEEISEAIVDRPPQVDGATKEIVNADVSRPPAKEDNIISEIEERWYRALRREDCVSVMELLIENPKLLRVGWEEDPSREWMGRTALHVGARRGCTELIVQVLEMCGALDLVRASEEREVREVLKRIEDRARAIASRPDQSHQTERDQGAARTDQSFPSSSQEGIAASSGDQETSDGNSKVPPHLTNLAGRTLGPALNKRKLEGTEESPRSQFRAQFFDLECELSDDARKAMLWMLRNEYGADQENAGVPDSPKPQCDQVGPQENRTKVDVFSKEDIHSLLSSTDGEYAMKAMEMASCHGNVCIMALLHIASHTGNLTDRIVHSIKSILPSLSFLPNDSQKRAHLRKATAEAFVNFPTDHEESWYSRAYFENLDLNFLPPEEYLFHFVLKNIGRDPENVLSLWRKISSSEDPELWRFVLELKDGQGRTPFHGTFTESPGNVYWLITRLIDERDGESDAAACALTTCDAAGRTPVYSAFTLEDRLVDIRTWTFLYVVLHRRGLKRSTETSIHAESSYPKELLDLVYAGSMAEKYKDVSKRAYRFRNSGTPLQVAIVHNKVDVVEKVLKWPMLDQSLHWYTWKAVAPRSAPDDSEHFVGLNVLEIAVLVGNERTVELLLNASYSPTSEPFSQTEVSKHKTMRRRILLNHPWQAIHFAAAAGKSNLLKLLIDNPKCDPFVEDFEGSTALHYALNLDAFQFDDGDRMNLLNYYQCKQRLPPSQGLRKAKEELSKDDIVQVQGCINLLLQAGCDVYKANKLKQIPYPVGLLSRNAEFLSWWYERQAKEFGIIQNSMNVAASAISVTATLVATASYVGPLQPPLGYATDPVTNQIQYGNVWVAIFLFCDTLSFYLAIVAIIFSLVPSLPMPQQPMMQELKRTRAMVIVAVSFLFPSIISVLIAFASSSMAVVSVNFISSVGGKLTLASLCICAPFLLMAVMVFFFRLMQNLFPRHPWIRKMYKLSDVLLLSFSSSN